MEKNIYKDILKYWNKRAGLGKWAGTRDIIAKQLEMEVILSFIKNGMNILDIGCGNGITALEIAKRFNAYIKGIDNAEEMIAKAKYLLKNSQIKGKVEFVVADVRSLPDVNEKFDVIYTERTIINLTRWSDQKKAIINIFGMLKKGGLYLMCENSQDGLDRVNMLRKNIKLSVIDPPWHNRYLRDKEINKISVSRIKLEKVVYYSSTYYFLSRVVNAWLAQQKGKEPDYESSINKLALRLPSIGEIGQGRIWLWRKS